MGRHRISQRKSEATGPAMGTGTRTMTTLDRPVGTVHIPTTAITTGKGTTDMELNYELGPDHDDQQFAVDLTPTWEGILPLLLAAYNSDTYKARTAAEQELRRMAKLADKWVDHCNNNPPKES